MNHLISVIIPTYKRPYRIIERAINSVLTQTHTNFELIIIDDSPPNDLNRIEVKKEITKIKDHRIKYIQHTSNLGACAARNTGIVQSNGNYLAFLDDDDEWLPKKLELQLEKLKASNVGLVYCGSRTITIKNDLEVNHAIRRKRLSGWVYKELISENFIGSTSFVMITREALQYCGYFKEELKSAQDYELWLRISKVFKVDFVDFPLVNYYIHEGERISTNVDNRIQGLEMINDLNIEYLRSHPKVFSIRKLKLTPYYAVKYGFKVALIKWFEAVKLYPFHKGNIEYLIRIIRSVMFK